jgi:hypothetical protein
MNRISHDKRKMTVELSEGYKQAQILMKKEV